MTNPSGKRRNDDPVPLARAMERLRLANGASGTAPKERRVTKAMERFAIEALEIQEEDARAAGTLGFLTRITALTHLPYRNVPESRFTRVNGPYHLHVQAPPQIGLPYGRYPRLLLAWITTEVVRTESRELDLGTSLSSFMGQIGVSTSGGAHGPFARFQDQLTRLLATTFQFFKITRDEKLHYTRNRSFLISDDSELWWQTPRNPDQPSLWTAKLVLTERFYQEILDHKIPVSLRALSALQAPLAMDLYVWLTYRLHSLSLPITVPWKALHLQCGSQTPRVAAFRTLVRDNLPKIRLVYPEARVEEADDHSGLVLKPSRPHIPHQVTYSLPLR